MAKQTGIALRGTFGNTIFYPLRGKNYMRAKPAHVERTAASVKSGLNFGKASRICKQLRELVAPLNPSNSDKRVMFRLTGALNKYINWKSSQPAAAFARITGIPYLNDFQFNDQAIEAGIKSINVLAKPTESAMPELSLSSFIPKSSLHAPEGTTQIVCRTLAISIDLEKVTSKLLGESEISIPCNDELFQPPDLSLIAASPGEIILVVIALEYQVNRNGEMQTDERMRYHPCGIVWSTSVV